MAEEDAGTPKQEPHTVMWGKIEGVRRIPAFLMLSSSKPEDVSQNSCVFKLADRQVDR